MSNGAKVYIYINKNFFIKEYYEDKDKTIDEVLSIYGDDNYDIYNTKSTNMTKYEVLFQSLRYYSSLNAMANTLYLKSCYIPDLKNDIIKENKNLYAEKIDLLYYQQLQDILQDNHLMTFELNGERMLTGFIDKSIIDVKTVNASGSQNAINFDLNIYDSTFDLVKDRLSDEKDATTADNILDVIKSSCYVNLNDSDSSGEGGIFLYPLPIRLQKTLNYEDLNISNSETRGNIGQSLSDYLQSLAKIKGLVIRGNGLGGIDIFSLNISDDTYNIMFDYTAELLTKQENNNNKNVILQKINEIKASSKSFEEKTEEINSLSKELLSINAIIDKVKTSNEVYIRKLLYVNEIISFRITNNHNSSYDYYRIFEGTSNLEKAVTIKTTKSLRFNRNIINKNVNIIDLINNINDADYKKGDIEIPSDFEAGNNEYNAYIRRKRGYSKIIKEGDILDGFDDEKYSLDLINQSSKIASMEDSAVVVDVLIEVFYKYKFKIGDFIQIVKDEIFIPYDFSYQSFVYNDDGKKVLRRINYYLLSKVEFNFSITGYTVRLHLSYRDAFTKYAMRESR